MRFVLVDEILALNPGKSIHARRTFPRSLEIFDDHFPGFPVVPGVLLTETMGQAASTCIQALATVKGRPMLAQIKSATFRRWVRPDETLDVHAQIKTLRPSFAAITASAEHQGVLVAETELLFSFAPVTQFGTLPPNQALERYWQQHPELAPVPATEET
jgi:3-hydroxyacyl-[acyl-carrier-protein] dehydratase